MTTSSSTTTRPPPDNTYQDNGGSLDREASEQLLQTIAARVERIDTEVESVVTLLETHADTLQALVLKMEEQQRAIETILRQQQTTQDLLRKALAPTTS